MPVRRFMVFDSLGGLFWVVTVTSLGLIFSDQLEQIALRWGGWLAVVHFDFTEHSTLIYQITLQTRSLKL